MSLRPRAASAAASRICANDIPLPFLLASTPFNDRVPGCTRMVAWSLSTVYSSLSPGLIRSALRIFPGMVVCPLLVTVECCIVLFLTVWNFLAFELSLTLNRFASAFPDRQAQCGHCAERQRRGTKPWVTGRITYCFGQQGMADTTYFRVVISPVQKTNVSSFENRFFPRII